MKSSKRGSRILSVVSSSPCNSQGKIGESITSGETSNQQMTSTDATSQTGILQPAASPYGWKPEYARMQNSFCPHETWLISQAQSFLGRQDVTLAEAQQLFDSIDITTRRHREIAAAQRPSGFLAALRAMVSGGMILLMASGCAKWTDNDPDYTMVSFNAGVRKVYDRDEGVVCYVSADGGISCMVAKPGDNQ